MTRQVLLEGRGSGSAEAGVKARRSRTPLPRKKKKALEPEEGLDPGTLPESPPLSLEEDPNGCNVNLLNLEVTIPDSIMDWTEQVKNIFKVRSTFSDLGRHLACVLSTLPTPFGNFVRSYCLAAQPTTSGSAPANESHGDLLPIAPWQITPEIEGVTSQNVVWVKLVVCAINFHYCTGWAKPICVPFKDGITDLQKDAVTRMAATVDANINTGHQVVSFSECDALLSSKKYDYAGRPVEYMEDLECEKLLPCWPRVGQAAVQPIELFLTEETKLAMANPRGLLLPKDKMPAKALRSKVRATDTEWFKIVKAGVERGMFKPVEDDQVPKDREGHLITNGAGAVYKEKIIDGVRTHCQRFISVLCPINAVTEPLRGSQDTLPYIGQLTGILLEEDESLYLESEDLQSAFNLFRVPDVWLGFFSYGKKTDSSAFGLPPGKQMRPALSVVPMGWHSAVAVVQEAVRDIVFRRAGVPRSLSAEKNRPLPEGKSIAVVYLDNFDEIEIIKSLDVDLTKEGTEMTQHHVNFNKACDEAGLPRNEGKQLIHAFAGGMQGGEFDGHRGILKLGADKLRNYIQLSLALLGKKKWNEFQLRHWTGKTAFTATFKRSLFSGISLVFDAIERSKKGDILPTAGVVDEIVCLMIQSVLSQVNLRARVSVEISCTDASPSGGGSGSATCFRDQGPQQMEKIQFTGICECCRRDISDRDEDDVYACPSQCGGKLCSVRCVSGHRDQCKRLDKRRPVFGERFSGMNYPLTKAVAKQGLFVQRPLDCLLEEQPWDFFTSEGKETLDTMEDDGELGCTHWAPECKTFSAARGKPIWTTSGRYLRGPPALRNADNPWGFQNISTTDKVKVRRGNSMARRSLRGVTEAHQGGRFVTLEHPWGSYLWFTPEMEKIIGTEGIFVTTFSSCCFGGRRTKWTTIVHNVPEIHRTMHREVCPGHEGLLPYEVHDEDGCLFFDTASEAEYPWVLCKAYAAALDSQLRLQNPSPVGDMPFDEESAILTALKSSTRGFQNPIWAARAAAQVFSMVREMKPGTEKDHLKTLLRQVCLRGTDIKLMATAEDGSEAVMSPYPAYMWQWETKLAYPWKQEQHINILEVSAFLVEFRRRTRTRASLGTRFFNITDSRVMFHCLTKGRSSSPRLNRLLRRVNAIILMAECLPLHLWTISKWNYADRPSRRFQQQ